MCCGTEVSSYLRRIDSCITQLKAQGPSRTCNENEEEGDTLLATGDLVVSERASPSCTNREIFIDDSLVGVHWIMEMIVEERPCAMGV